MRFKVATFADLRADVAAIYHPASAPTSTETLTFGELALEDIPDDVLELRDAILVPEGGIVWRDYWIAREVMYCPPDWYDRTYRPGDFDPATNTIEIPPENLLPDRRIESPVMLTDSRLAAANFGHFVHDFLPYGLVFRRLRSSLPGLRPLFQAMSWDSQKRLIHAVFGLPYGACAQSGSVTGVRHLFVPRRQSYLEGPVWSISFAGLRAARASALDEFGITPPGHAAPCAMVFLHREQNVDLLIEYGLLQGRDYTNVPELTGEMLRRGLVALEPGRVPIEVVAALLARARLVVGIHGANMANMLFCPPGTRVFELRASGGNWRDYEAMAGVLGLEFRAIYQPYASPGTPASIDLDALALAINGPGLTEPSSVDGVSQPRLLTTWQETPRSATQTVDRIVDMPNQPEPFERYLLDLPMLHSWDDGQTWNTGGFGTEHLRAIHDLVRSGGAPMRVLETGAGNSTVCFLLAGATEVTSIAPDAALFSRIRDYCAKWSIDISPWRAEVALSEHALPAIAEKARPGGASIDFALLDGAHGWPTVFVDFCYAYEMLRHGGYMMIDDIQIHAVKELARFMSRSWQFEQVTDLGKSLIFRKVAAQASMSDFGAQPYIMEMTRRDADAGRAYTLF